MAYSAGVSTMQRSLWRDLISLVFAGLWAGRGLSMMGAAPEAFLLLGVVCVVTALGIYWRDAVHHHADRVLDRALDQCVRRGRIIGIIIAVALCRQGPYQDLLLPAISMVLGLSRIVESRAIAEATYLPAGLGVVAVAACGFVVPGHWHGVVAGIGTAVVLWVALLLRITRFTSTTREEAIIDSAL